MLKRRILISVALLLISVLTATLAKPRREPPPVAESYQIPAPEGAQTRLGRGTLNAISVSPDGKQVAVASGVGVYVHDSQTLDDIWFGETDSPVSAIAYAPGSGRHPKELAAGLQDGTVLLWKVPTTMISIAGPPRKVGTHDDPVTSVAWSPDSTLLASGSASGHVIVWDLATGEPRYEVDVWEEGIQGHTGLSFSPDGTLLAGNYSYGNVIVWEVAAGTVVWQIHERNSPVANFTWLPDGTGLVFRRLDTTAELWDIRTGEMLRVYPDLDSLDETPHVVVDGQRLAYTYGYLDRVYGVTWSPTGDELLSGTRNTIYRWNPQTWQVSPLNWTNGGGTSAPLAFTPDGQTLVANEGTAGNGQVHFLEAASGRILGNAYANSYQVHSIAVSPDGSILATGSSFDPYVYLFDTETYELLTRLEGPTWGAIDFAWSPDSETLATLWAESRYTGRPGNDVVIWDVATGDQLGSIFTETQVTSIARHPDGSLLAFGINGGELSVWSLETARHSVTLDGDHVGSTGSVEWSQDRSMLATASSDNSITVWALATGEAIHTFVGHTDRVWDLAWQPGGNLLASASWDGTVIVWEVNQQ
jgi:WD40 repeat protein